jgi:hypothetical protein
MIITGRATIRRGQPRRPAPRRTGSYLSIPILCCLAGLGACPILPLLQGDADGCCSTTTLSMYVWMYVCTYIHTYRHTDIHPYIPSPALSVSLAIWRDRHQKSAPELIPRDQNEKSSPDLSSSSGIHLSAPSTQLHISTAVLWSPRKGDFSRAGWRSSG